MYAFKGQFIIAATLRHLRSGTVFTIASVYGPPHHASRAAFFAELSLFIGTCNNHLILGGDFNVTTGTHERRNCVGHTRDAGHFSRIIAGSNLLDLPISGVQFTWSNRQRLPRLAKLDRIFLSLSASHILPLANVQGGDKKLSDHHHLILCSMQSPTNKSVKPFKMEKFWFRVDSFKCMIATCWAQNWDSLPATDRWIRRWRTLRKLIRQWNALHNKEVKKARITLEDQVAALDRKVDTGNINDREINELRGAKQHLDTLYSDEDTFWRQRAKQRWIRMGDRNTRYFHQCASNSRRKNWIHSLDGLAGVLNDIQEIKNEFRKFYSNLLGRPSTPLLNLRWNTLDLVQLPQNSGIDGCFTMDEIYSSIRDLGSFKSPGPDGIINEFLLQFWDCIKDDLLGLNYKVGNGADIQIWREPWCGSTTLAENFTHLFRFATQPLIRIADARILDDEGRFQGWNISFTTYMNISQVQQLARKLERIQDTRGMDVIFWRWSNSMMFSTKSLYQILIYKGIEDNLQGFIWQRKLPPKIAIYGWIWKRKRLPLRTVLASRGVISTTTNCLLCDGNDETHDHVFFDCLYAQNAWHIFLGQLGIPFYPTRSFFFDDGNAPHSENNLKNARILLVWSWFIWCERNKRCFEMVLSNYRSLAITMVAFACNSMIL
ncbi:ribonuclease H protein [Canna indica]|uniref:Ribonuclease H protein n=1 Tax=Canna indica TaxID=4628 RepID=A0AAQ3JQD3_9LILI|nr:ribonuclease H protein [Canna indica]